MVKAKRLVAALLIVGMIATLTACGSAEGKYKPGTYEGEGTGNGGPIKVEVTVDKDKIKNIEVIEQNETPVLSDPAFEQIIESVIKENDVNVEPVSGATVTSNGLIEAIKDALSKAGAEFSDSEDKSASSAKKEEETEQTYDVVVLGGGGAGLAAAIEAKDAGASVVVLEKMSAVGGNTLISGGEMNAPENWVQEKLGIEDSVELFYEDTMKGGDNLADPEVVKTFAEKALESAEWLKDKINVEFVSDHLFQFGGHSVKRALIPKGQTGAELITKLMAKVDELEIPVKLGTKAESLITDDNGKVVGVKASNKAGQDLTFNANKGVIIATGGFGSNVEMRKKYNPELDERYKSTDTPGTTGDGITMAQKVGADITNMKNIQTYPICNPKTGMISLVADARFDGGILVNQEGKRFVEELERRDVISEGILSQTGKYGYLLWNQKVADIGKTIEAHPEEYEALVKDKILCKADTLEEAAEFFDIPADQLKKTVERWNGFVAKGKDEDFNYRGKLTALDEGPFYIQKAVPSVHHTMGGLVIDKDAHVVDKDGKKISGLYAAGEVTGVIHGSNRLGGNAIADIITFGRIAGKNAVEEN